MSSTRAGTRSERTTRVSMRTPKATMNAICDEERQGDDAQRGERGGEHHARGRDDTAGGRQPADTPSRTPWRSDSSRTRDIRKML